MKKSSIKLGEALTLIREFHDFNQGDLAKKLKVSQSLLSELEADKRTPSLKTLEKYSLFFDINESCIFLLAEALGRRPLTQNNHLWGSVGDKLFRMIKWAAIKENEKTRKLLSNMINDNNPTVAYLKKQRNKVSSG